MIVTTCCECRNIIRDEYIFKVLDRNWHASCLRCCLCKSVLRDRCYAKDEQVYCKDDFYRTLMVVCAGCGLKIEPKDFVRKARHSIYHVNCFSCAICRKLLNTGEELYPLENGKIICKKDAIAKERNFHNSGVDKHSFEAHNSALIREVESKSFKKIGLTGSRDDLTESQVKNKEHPTVESTFDPLDEKHKSSKFDANLNENSLEELFQMNNSDGSTGSNTDFDGPSQVAKPACHSANLSPESADSSDEDKDNNNDKTTDDANKDEIESETGGIIQNGVGAKRRGPRTTIKAKQLETLKSAFAATPKPTRHIREQLAQDTGLNMRVIQVWFQNRRSKERRLKQMTVIGARRPYYRNPRRVRVLRGEEDAIIQHGDHALSYQGYYQDTMEHFYHTFQSNLYTPDYLMTLDQHHLQQFHQQDPKQPVTNQPQLILRHPMVVSSNQKMPNRIGNFKSDKEAPMITDFQEFYSEQNPNDSDEQLVRSVEDVKKSAAETRAVDSQSGFMTAELQAGKAEDVRIVDMVYEDDSPNMSRCHQSFGDLFGGNAFDHMINVTGNPQHSQETLVIRSW